MTFDLNTENVYFESYKSDFLTVLQTVKYTFKKTRNLTCVHCKILFIRLIITMFFLYQYSS